MTARFRKLLFSLALPILPLLAHAQAPVGELYSTVARVRGAVTLASGGTTVLSGSSIESGEQPARLVLNRGGHLTICQGTSVAVSASANGRDLMFSFGSGTIESRYLIAASSDVIITPDFRFVITGPGEFDLDLGITPAGDTCVRSHPDSTGGVIVNEQMGDGTYQVKPSDFVIFPKGHVANAMVNPAGMSCGCPVPKPTYVAKAPVAPALASSPAAAPTAPAASSLAEKSPSKEEHVTVDAPFVFNADQPAPAPTARVLRLSVESTSAIAPLNPKVQPPPKKKGFWRRFGKALFG